MHHAAGDGAKFAVVGVLVQVDKLVFGDCDSFGCVDQDLDGRSERVAAVSALDVAVHIAFHNPGGGDVLETPPVFQFTTSGSISSHLPAFL